MDEIHQDADMNRELMLDGNSIGGLLHELFAGDMTAMPAECAHCGNEAEMGALLAFSQSPGTVLRCPACEQVMLRIVQTPDAIYLDARGVTHLRIARNNRIMSTPSSSMNTAS